MHRWHSTQRSRSSRISVDTAMGLVKTRFGSRSRVSAAPLAIVWFCSGHSPPLSQIGQSSGWLRSRNSRLRALRLLGDRRGDLGLDDHAVGDHLGAGGLGFRHRPATHLDLDQALPASTDGLEQWVVAEPRDGDTDPLGGADHQLTLGGDDLDAVDDQPDMTLRNGLRLAGRTAWRRSSPSDFASGHQCAPTNARDSTTRWRPAGDQILELAAEQLEGAQHGRRRGVAERAERPAGDVAGGVGHHVEILQRALTGHHPAQDLRPASRCPPGTACTCRTTRACRTPATSRPPTAPRRSR